MSIKNGINKSRFFFKNDACQILFSVPKYTVRSTKILNLILFIYLYKVPFYVLFFDIFVDWMTDFWQGNIVPLMS